MLGGYKLDNILFTCEQGNLNQITARSRNPTLVTVVRDTCTTTVPLAPHKETKIIIASGNLDADYITDASLFVIFVDGISPARTAEAIVVVDVIDVSDHGPIFHQSHYNATVFENVPVDTTVLTVMATDNDKVGVLSGDK